MKKLTMLLTAIFALAMTQTAQAGPRISGGVSIFFGNPDSYYYDGHAHGHHYGDHRNNHWKKHRYFVHDCRYCHHWRDYHYRPRPPGNAYGHYKFRGNAYRGDFYRGNYYRDDYRGRRGRGGWDDDRYDRGRRGRGRRGR